MYTFNLLPEATVQMEKKTEVEKGSHMGTHSYPGNGKQSPWLANDSIPKCNVEFQVHSSPCVKLRVCYVCRGFTWVILGVSLLHVCRDNVFL